MLINWYQNILLNNIYKYFILFYFILIYFYINWNEEKLIIFIIVFCLYIFTFNFSFILSNLYKTYIINILYKFNQNNFIHQENLLSWIVYLNKFKSFFYFNFKMQLNKCFRLIYLIIFNKKNFNYNINKKFLIINFFFFYIFFNKFCLKFINIL